MKFSKTPAFSIFLATLLCLSLARPPPDFNSTQVPVIGIISTAGPDRDDSDTYIKTNYAEFVEAGGAKVVPIPWDIDDKKFNTLLDSVNGVLFTGGGAYLWDEDDDGKRKLNSFQKKLNYVVDVVMQKKKKGIHFPLFAICQGFEAVGLAVTKDLYLFDIYDHFGTLSEVTFTAEAQNSTLFQYFTQDSFDVLQNNPAMYYWHEYGFNTSVPTLYPSLASDKWIVTGTSKDDNGKEFLATMESKDYPIYMVMFHPERVLYEGTHDPTATHLTGVIYAIKLMAKSFITEAAKNKNQFENQGLLNALIIENFPASNWSGRGLYYIFDKHSLDETWEEFSDDSNSRGWIFIGILILVAVGIIAYYKYKEKQKKPENGYGEFVDQGVELK